MLPQCIADSLEERIPILHPVEQVWSFEKAYEEVIDTRLVMFLENLVPAHEKALELAQISLIRSNGQYLLSYVQSKNVIACEIVVSIGFTQDLRDI